MIYPKKKDQMDLIGAECTFTREIFPDYFKNGKRKWVRSPLRKAQTGKIVGFGCNYNGQFIPKNNGFFNPNDCDTAHFKPSKRVVHIKVAIKGEGAPLRIHPLDCKIKDK